MFGIGYATGEDRLFLADALRHAGRGDLSSFAGGANVAQDRDTFENAPYASDAELQAQFDRADDLYGQRGVQIQEDAQNYVDGINQWIAETKINPTKLDALYALTNHPLGPEPWKLSDVVATGALVAGIFGKGGGDELGAATALEDAKQALGRKRGKLVWRDFRSADDPERRAPSTSRSSPTGSRRRASRAGWRCPIRARCGASASSPTRARRPAPSAIRREHCSRASTRSPRARTPSSSAANESESGHPIAVFGPQTGYFAPQLLMEEDIHAPAGPEGPAIDARGVAFTGSNLYVQLGRGRDYSWSATSSGQDIIDTFAVKLCEPDGGTPTRASLDYEFNGRCLPMEELTHTNSWLPNVADQTPAGKRDPARLPDEGGPGDRDRDDRRQAVRLHEAARHLQPRGRLGDLLRRLEQPRRGQEREDLDQGRLHRRPDLQLVLHRRRAHRLLQLGRRSGSRQEHAPQLPGLRQAAVHVEGLRPGPEHLQA